MSGLPERRGGLSGLGATAPSFCGPAGTTRGRIDPAVVATMTLEEFYNCRPECRPPVADAGMAFVCQAAAAQTRTGVTLLAEQAAVRAAASAERLASEGGGVRCPTTPSESMFRYQGNNRDLCLNEAWLYSGPCTRETLLCIMFRQARYAELARALTGLLARRPTTVATPEAKVFWCRDVLTAVGQAFDATNLQAWLFGGGTAVYHIPAAGGGSIERIAVPFRSRSALDLDGVKAVRTRYNEQHPRSRGFTRLFPVDLAITQRAFGTTGAVQFRLHIDNRMGAYRRRGSYPTLMSDPMTNLIRIWGALPTATTIPISQYRVIREAEMGACPVWNPDCNDPASLGWIDAEIMGAEPTMDLCAAYAQHIINTNFAVFVAQGFERFIEALTPFADRGMLRLTGAQVRELGSNFARENARALAGNPALTSGATIIGLVAGPVGAALIGAVMAVIAMLAEILPMAAGWSNPSCPPIPYKRTFDPATAPECSFSDAYQLVERAAASGRSVVDTARDQQQTMEDRSGLDIHQPDSDSTWRPLEDSTGKASTGKIIAATTIGLLLGGGATYYFVR